MQNLPIYHTKSTIDKRKKNFIKFINFCASKDTVKRVQRKDTEWDNMFANHILLMNIHLEYIKNSYPSIITRQVILKFLNWANNLNRYFSKEDK